MIKHGVTPQLNGSHLLYAAFVFYANYQVFKWVFNVLKNVATSSFVNAISYKLTPNTVIKKRAIRQKIKMLHEKKQKEKDHQESLENHRKYKAPFFTLGFIAEDRATLFKGYEDIKWQWGNQRIDSSNPLWVPKYDTLEPDFRGCKCAI